MAMGTEYIHQSWRNATHAGAKLWVRSPISWLAHDKSAQLPQSRPTLMSQSSRPTWLDVNLDQDRRRYAR